MSSFGSVALLVLLFVALSLCGLLWSIFKVALSRRATGPVRMLWVVFTFLGPVTAGACMNGALFFATYLAWGPAVYGLFLLCTKKPLSEQATDSTKENT